MANHFEEKLDLFSKAPSQQLAASKSRHLIRWDVGMTFYESAVRYGVILEILDILDMLPVLDFHIFPFHIYPIQRWIGVQWLCESDESVQGGNLHLFLPAASLRCAGCRNSRNTFWTFLDHTISYGCFLQFAVHCGGPKL